MPTPSFLRSGSASSLHFLTSLGIGWGLSTWVPKLTFCTHAACRKSTSGCPGPHPSALNFQADRFIPLTSHLFPSCYHRLDLSTVACHLELSVSLLGVCLIPDCLLKILKPHWSCLGSVSTWAWLSRIWESSLCSSLKIGSKTLPSPKELPCCPNTAHWVGLGSLDPGVPPRP